jgi:hypothetical protein
VKGLGQRFKMGTMVVRAQEAYLEGAWTRWLCQPTVAVQWLNTIIAVVHYLTMGTHSEK